MHFTRVYRVSPTIARGKLEGVIPPSVFEVGDVPVSIAELHRRCTHVSSETWAVFSRRVSTSSIIHGCCCGLALREIKPAIMFRSSFLREFVLLVVFIWRHRGAAINRGEGGGQDGRTGCREVDQVNDFNFFWVAQSRAGNGKDKFSCVSSQNSKFGSKVRKISDTSNTGYMTMIKD